MNAVVGTSLSLVLSLGQGTAVVAPAPEQPQQEPPTDVGIPADAEALGKARELYSRGETRYETFDYEGAIDLWTEAYGKLRESPQSSAVRAALVYNIATARVNAYEVDKDVRQLHRAKLLLSKYIADYVQIYGDNFETLQEISKIKAKQEEIDRMIAEVERTGTADVEQSSGPVDLGELDPAPPAQPSAEPTDRKRKLGPMGIAGIVTASLGVAMAGVMVGGLVGGMKKRDDYEQLGADREGLEAEGITMNRLAVGSGIAAGALVVTGVVLLVVDVTKRRRNVTARRLDAGPTSLAIHF